MNCGGVIDAGCEARGFSASTGKGLELTVCGLYLAGVSFATSIVRAVQDVDLAVFTEQSDTPLRDFHSCVRISQH